MHIFTISLEWNREQIWLNSITEVDCWVKTKLLKAYCSSFYGSELWDLGNGNINALCTAWRQALRRVWKLPYNCHKIIIDVLSDSLSIFDLLCKRSLSLRLLEVVCSLIITWSSLFHIMLYSMTAWGLVWDVMFSCAVSVFLWLWLMLLAAYFPLELLMTCAGIKLMMMWLGMWNAL